MKSRSVCIVGGGVIGLSCAEQLLRRGFAVTVVAPSTGQEDCSFGNGGLIVPSHFEPLATPGLLRSGLKMLLKKDSPFGLAGGLDFATLRWTVRFAMSATSAHVEQCAPILCDLHLASRELYAQVEQRFGFEFGYEKRGLAMVCQSFPAFESERKLLAHAERLGLGGHEVAKEDLAAGKFGVPLNAMGAVYFEDDAQLSPPMFMEGMRSYLQSRGVEFIAGSALSLMDPSPVNRPERSEIPSIGNRSRILSVRTPQGDFEADEFVLCAGVWSRELARSIGVNLPLLAGRGCGFTATGVLSELTTPLILTEARVAVTPYGNETRFVGLMELGRPGFTCNPKRVAAMKRSISAALPQVSAGDLDPLPVWVGNRPCTPDGMPIIGRTAKFENLTIATGHAMMGMSLGPITGQLVAEVIVGDQPSIDLSLMSPERFA